MLLSFSWLHLLNRLSLHFTCCTIIYGNLFLSIFVFPLNNSYLPRPETQWTATQLPGSSWNFFFSKLSQSSTSLFGGGAPSSKGQSYKIRLKLLYFYNRVIACISESDAWLCTYQYVNAIFLKWCFVVGAVTNSHHCCDTILF